MCTPGMRRFATAVGREHRHSASLGNWKKRAGGAGAHPTGYCIGGAGGLSQPKSECKYLVRDPHQGSVVMPEKSKCDTDCPSPEQFILVFLANEERVIALLLHGLPLLK